MYNLLLAILFLMVSGLACAEDVEVSPARLQTTSERQLAIPPLSKGKPAAGKRVAVTPEEFSGTNVFHTLYLPPNWTPNGPPLPIIFEYTGNFHPQSGSTGEPEDAALGYGLSGGRYIWVSLPYISKDGTNNAVTWWGDDKATVEYAKRMVPRIIHDYNADSDVVVLCGFSRGAIGVNYLGLHDDEIAKLWTAFVSHDHFDGVRAWGRTGWGSPLAKYRTAAIARLKRVGNRPYLVSQNGVSNGKSYGSEELIRSVLPDSGNFTFLTVNTREIFGTFPNEFAKTSHTDRWPILPGKYRSTTWNWMNELSTFPAQIKIREQRQNTKKKTK